MRTHLHSAIRRALYGTSALALAAPLCFAPAAYAQDDAEELETITVVGSRIKRTDIETSQPVFVIEREDLQRTGLQSVGDISPFGRFDGAGIPNLTDDDPPISFSNFANSFDPNYDIPGRFRYVQYMQKF